MYEEINRDMLSFIYESPTAYNAVENFELMLKNAGFEKINSYNAVLSDKKKYYITKNSSAIIAFVYSAKADKLNMACAHSDSPSLRLKPLSVMKNENNSARLNVEVYGGPIMYSWLDRPLSVAGRVVYQAEGKVLEKSVNIKKDFAIIPSVAIHFNRNVNDGYKFNPQTDLLPLIAQEMSQQDFNELICEAAGVEPESFLSSELFLYPRQQGICWGEKKEFISAYRLDDMMCAYSLMKALCEVKSFDENIMPIACVFDNEEVGSTTKQGADSEFLSELITLLAENAKLNKAQLIENSFMISADNAHAVHPNHPELTDCLNNAYLNSGVVIKRSGNQKYATDAKSEGTFISLCKRTNTPYRFFANRSDMAGGSTVGNISTSHVSVSTVDIGLPMLAMHSAFETAGAMDAGYFIDLLRAYFTGK